MLRTRAYDLFSRSWTSAFVICGADVINLKVESISSVLPA